MDILIVKNEHETRIIKVNSLLAIEVSDYLCTFYIENERSFSCVKSLHMIHSKLPEFFIRISKNCIINTRHVISINYKRREVELTESRVCSFSVRNAKKLRKVFN